MAAQSRRLVIGGVGIVVALALVVVAALNQAVWLGAVGFALMVAAGVWAFAPARRSGPTGVVDPSGSVRPTAPTKRQPRQTGTDGFMHRLEERWERRSHEE